MTRLSAFFQNKDNIWLFNVINNNHTCCKMHEKRIDNKSPLVSYYFNTIYLVQHQVSIGDSPCIVIFIFCVDQKSKMADFIGHCLTMRLWMKSSNLIEHKCAWKTIKWFQYTMTVRNWLLFLLCYALVYFSCLSFYIQVAIVL